MFKQTGGKINSSQLRKYKKSPQWQDGKFENMLQTSLGVSPIDVPKLLYRQFFIKKNRRPSIALPVEPFNEEDFLSPSDKAKFIWYGHSVVLMRIKNKTLLIDPMFGTDAAPVAPFSIKRFSENTLQIIDDLPKIDLVLLTHDHYDHLDYKSIKKLFLKTKQFYVALGVARHLHSWGVPSKKIREFDWWDSLEYEGIQITFTPTRHFSGRGFTDRAKSLWGGWVFKTKSENIYFSGDSGYGPHFKEIGERLGSFDFGFIECGQYNKKWHEIHMFPKESIQAGLDVRAKVIMPVHWGGFSLALHSWTEPIENFIAFAKAKQMNFTIPELGTVFSADSRLQKNWWEGYK